MVPKVSWYSIFNWLAAQVFLWHSWDPHKGEGVKKQKKSSHLSFVEVRKQLTLKLISWHGLHKTTGCAPGPSPHYRNPLHTRLDRRASRRALALRQFSAAAPCWGGGGVSCRCQWEELGLTNPRIPFQKYISTTGKWSLAVATSKAFRK